MQEMVRKIYRRVRSAYSEDDERLPQKLLLSLSMPVFSALYRYLCQRLNRDVVSEIFSLVFDLTQTGCWLDDIDNQSVKVQMTIINSEAKLLDYLEHELDCI